MIAWCGSRSDGLSWLSERSESLDELRTVDSLSIEAVDAVCSLRPRRLILAVENRHEYPLETIQHLQRSWPEVPFAVAMGSWFDGSRRTGIGATRHLCLPWYRWWDGWLGWLLTVNASQHSSEESIRSARGIIACDCQQTAAGWREAITRDSADSAVRWFSSSEFHKWLHQVRAGEQSVAEENGVELNWVLWDDSCLNTFAGSECLGDVSDWFTSVRDQFPDVTIIAATCAPRWDEWQRWVAAGANELIAKPSCRISLNEILSGQNLAFER